MSALFRLASQFTAVSLLCLLAIPSSPQTADTVDYTYCSMISLLASPEKFDGIRVKTVGVARIEFEGNAIYLTIEQAGKRIFANGIRIRLPGDDFTPWQDFAHLSGKYVSIEGVFRKPDPQQQLFRGTITDVKSLYPLEGAEIEE